VNLFLFFCALCLEADMTSLVDTERVQRAVAGDAEAFAELVTQYRDAVYGVCYHRAGNAEEAKDLAQEAFLRAYLDLAQLRQPGAFPAWIRRVAERVCATWRRSQRLRLVSLEMVPEPYHERDQELPLVIRQALARLSDDARLALTLFHINGYSMREVAQFLDVPLGTVKSRLHYARQQMRGALMDEYKDRLRQGAPGPEFDGAVVRAVRSLEEGKNLPWSQYFDPAAEQDLKRYLVLEKDGTVLGVSYYGEGTANIRGVKVRVAGCHVTSGENEWEQDGTATYDRLMPAILANLAEMGYGIAITHEEMMSAPRHGYVPCFYHFRITAPAANLLRGRPSGTIRPYTEEDRERYDYLKTLPRARPSMGAWDPGELPPFVLERDGVVVGYCCVNVKHEWVPPWLTNEMEAVDMAAYMDLARHVAEMAQAEGDTTISAYLSPQHPLGMLLLARGGTCEMKAAGWNVAAHDEFVGILDLTLALRAIAPGLGRIAKGKVSIDMDGDIATISAGEPPIVSAGAQGPVSRIGWVPMTQLLAGYHSVFEIAGRPEVAIREEDLPVLDALFPKSWPYSTPDPYVWFEEALLRRRPYIKEEPWLSRLSAHPRPWAL
jgi:RNA polymerase sigma-70 factor, ECF subfamily